MHSWGSTIVEREVENLKGHTYKVATERRTTIYFPPFFRRAKPGGKRKACARGATDTRDGKMFPPCVSHEHSAPQSLRAGLRSPVKREKMSPVLQTTYNSQMRPERLETISFDRVYQCAQPRSPTLWLGTLQYKKFLDSSLQIRQDPNTDLYGLRLFLKFL